MLFKLSNLDSNLALTLGYLNPALNNSAQGNINAVVFLDLKKAFDRVHHTVLLSKTCYGMTGLKGDWFRSYLSSRTQSCAVNSCKLGRHLLQVVCLRGPF